MCSINECACDAVGDRPIIRRIEASSLVSDAPRVCKKCRTEDIHVVLKATDGGYCKSCFLTRTSHKFRATLGKSKIIRKDDSVLVFHNGTSSSTALLHLIKAAQNESAQKRLLMKAVVLYIDENLPDDRSSEDRRTSMASAVDQIRKLGFTAYTTSLASFSTETVPLKAVDDTWQPTLDVPNEATSATFSSLTDRSALEDLITTLRRRLLINVARQLSCDKVLMPDTSLDIAVRLLSNLALGRGAQLPSDVDFIDARFTGVMFLRPLKDFNAEEVVHYLNYCGVSTVAEEKSAEDVATNKPSLQALTRNFVRRLDDEFSGTVSTIFRTGGKLSGEVPDGGEAGDVCTLCNAALDSEAKDDRLFAIRATDFSKLVSSCSKVEWEVDGDGAFEEADPGRGSLTEESEKAGKRTLCYGCRLILYNCGDCAEVPSLVSQSKQ